MGETIDLGRRMELVPMDPHFHNISIALYRQVGGNGPVFLVHSYSKRDGTRQRVEFVARAMAILGGLELRLQPGLGIFQQSLRLRVVRLQREGLDQSGGRLLVLARGK